MPRAQNRSGKGSILLWRRYSFPIFLLFIYGWASQMKLHLTGDILLCHCMATVLWRHIRQSSFTVNNISYGYIYVLQYSDVKKKSIWKLFYSWCTHNVHCKFYGNITTSSTGTCCESEYHAPNTLSPNTHVVNVHCTLYSTCTKLIELEPNTILGWNLLVVLCLHCTMYSAVYKLQPKHWTGIQQHVVLKPSRMFWGTETCSLEHVMLYRSQHVVVGRTKHNVIDSNKMLYYRNAGELYWSWNINCPMLYRNPTTCCNNATHTCCCK